MRTGLQISRLPAGISEASYFSSRIRLVVCRLTLLLCLIATLAAGTVKYTYDSTGRLTKAIYGNGVVIAYEYDSSGNLLRRTVELPSIDLYFPFYQSNALAYTGLGLSNYSDRPASLRFFAYDMQGRIVPGSRNPAAITLPARNQLARIADEIFGINPAITPAGWVQLSSDNADLGNLFQIGGPNQLDGSVAFSKGYRRLFFTRIFEGPKAFRGQTAVTYLSIANPYDQDATVRIRLRGTLALEKTTTIAAKGLLYSSIGDLFGQAVDIGSGYLDVEVLQGNGIVGFELVRLPACSTVIGLTGVPGNSSSDSFSAQMATGRQSPGLSFFTEIKLVNVGSAPRTAVIRVLGNDGNQLAAAMNFTLDPGQALERDIGQMFAFGNSASSPLQVGSLRVETNGSDVIGDVVFGDPLALQFAAALPLQAQAFSRAVFSQVANGQGYYTGLAFYNPGNTAADITLEVFREDGQSAGAITLSLGAGKRVSNLLAELVPASNQQMRGYVLVRSTLPLIGQELFGDTSLTFLSAVPPTIIN